MLSTQTNHQTAALMQSERTLDLFFFQQYEWFRNKISAEDYGLNGSLLAGVNDWQQESEREEPGQEKERAAGVAGLR